MICHNMGEHFLSAVASNNSCPPALAHRCAHLLLSGREQALCVQAAGQGLEFVPWPQEGEGTGPWPGAGHTRDAAERLHLIPQNPQRYRPQQAPLWLPRQTLQPQSQLQPPPSQVAKLQHEAAWRRRQQKQKQPQVQVQVQVQQPHQALAQAQVQVQAQQPPLLHHAPELGQPHHPAGSSLPHHPGSFLPHAESPHGDHNLHDVLLREQLLFAGMLPMAFFLLDLVVFKGYATAQLKAWAKRHWRRCVRGQVRGSGKPRPAPPAGSSNGAKLPTSLQARPPWQSIPL